MTRIQRLAGQLKFGELDDCSMWYEDTRNALIIKDSQGATLVEFGDDLTDVQNAIRGYMFQQLRTVDLFAVVELPLGTLVDASGAANDAVTTSGVNSTAVVGVSISSPHVINTTGPICTVPGSVVGINLVAAGVSGQYVQSVGAGVGQCVIGLPAVGRTVGMCIQGTGGAGVARCIFLRM